MIERGKDFGEENVVGPNDNVVRMMTIHSSKGTSSICHLFWIVKRF
ncbi:hypothetical protein ACVNPZ_10270 [Staphylococcus aureus]